MKSWLHDSQHWITFWRDQSDKALISAAHVVAILIGYLVLRLLLYRLIDGVLSRLIALDHSENHGRADRLRTLRGMCKSVVAYALFFLFGILLLEAIGFNILPFITTVGVVGLAIGFGAQKLVKDVISGFFIIIDQLFVVGDTITVGAITGQVMEMGMRVTRLHDASGKIYLLANGDIGTVTNHSRFPVEDFVDVQVGAAADLTKTTLVINTALAELYDKEPESLDAAPQVLGLTAFSATSITVRVGVFADPRSLASEQMRVRAGARAALLAAEIPLAP